MQSVRPINYVEIHDINRIIIAMFYSRNLLIIEIHEMLLSKLPAP